MDKQVVEGTGKGRKGRKVEAETPVVESGPAPTRSAADQFRDIQARMAQAQADLADLAARCAAKGVTQLVIDGRQLQVRKARGEEGHYFYDPSSRPAKEKAGPASGDALLV